MAKLRITKLPRHAHTHAYGGVDALPTNSIGRTQIQPLGVFHVGAASPTPGTGGAYGAAVTITPTAGKSLVPLAAKLEWGGTFATGETVSIRITAVYNDGTSVSIERSATAAGSINLNSADLSPLYANGKYIVRLDIDSSSSATATSVTTSVAIYSLEI
jgi:hypothetical protein